MGLFLDVKAEELRAYAGIVQRTSCMKVPEEMLIYRGPAAEDFEDSVHFRYTYNHQHLITALNGGDTQRHAILAHRPTSDEAGQLSGADS